MRAVFMIIGILMMLGGFGFAIATPNNASPDPTLGFFAAAIGFFILIAALTAGRKSHGYGGDGYDGSPRRWRSTRRRSSGSSRSSGGSWSSFGGSSGGSSGGFSGFGRSSSRSKSRSSRSSSRSSSRKGGSGRRGGSGRKSR